MRKNSSKNWCLLLLFLCSVAFGQNQNKLFTDFGNGSYTTYKTETSFNYDNVKKIKFIPVTKPWPVSLEMGSSKDFDGNLQVASVIVSRQGVIKEKFVADIPENPVYFAYKDFRLSVIDDKIYYYEWNNNNATIIYLLTKSGVDSYDSEIEKVNNHIRNSFKNQQGAKGKIAEVKEANAKKEAIENSLKGKTVKNIEIVMVDVPKELGVKSTVKFGVKATTADGKTYSTPNLGGKTLWEDFTITTTDGTYVDDAIEIHEDASKITNDELKFTVAVKYAPSVSSQKTIPLNYAFTTYTIDKTGRSSNTLASLAMIGGTVKSSEAGKSLDLKIQKGSTKKTNLPIYKIEVTDVATGKIIYRLKLSKNTLLHVYAKGGPTDNGMDQKTLSFGKAKKAGDGTSGGDGGTITVSKSADAMDINLNIYNNGAKGGRGGIGVSISYNGTPGRDGRDGAIINKPFTGNLSW